MRILQVILAPRLSGAEVLVKGVAIGHQRAGHSVCIASLLPQHSDFVAQSLCLLELCADIAHDRRNSSQSARVINKGHDGEGDRDRLAVLTNGGTDKSWPSP